jgi:hypothetical protein
MGLQQSLMPSIDFRIVSEQDKARELLDQAEQKDFYVEECRDDHANALARRGLVYQARAMTPEEVSLFHVVVENAKEVIPLRLRTELREPVWLVALDSSAEGGMPHTRPDHVICYPDIYRTFSVSTLLHELWHIHQRQYAGWWLEVFRSWGWEMWESGAVNGVGNGLPLTLENHRRFNPDTLDAPLWCFQRTWLPIPIFRDVVSPRVGEVDIWFYHVTLRYHVKRVPREMTEVYPPSLPSSAYEHPRELAAYLLSEPDRYRDSPALQQLMDIVGGISFPSHRVKERD